jgi:2,3-bisphosphoglycerate-independent phosphoglycerate mutase
LKTIIAIMDGYGLREARENNATRLATTPHLNAIFEQYPHVTLKTSGRDVGLPAGQMGNSEVGHLNIGAGRIVYQDITRIDRAIEDGDYYQSPALNNLLDDLERRNRFLHLLGLVSSGGVHSSMEHLRATLEFCRRRNFRRVVLHAFTDGRDTPPQSGIGFITEVESWMLELGVGRIQTVSGRYYAMDRDKRWDRVQKAYRAIAQAEGNYAPSTIAALEASYAAGVTDEFVIPTIIESAGETQSLTSEDGVFFFNFRADRTRELTDALTMPSFDAFAAPVKVTHFVTMTRYREDYNFPVVSPPQKLTNILGERIAEAGLKQLRIAETEKYPHVTFFFNGGEETPFPGEFRILIPSPRIATYDLQPEMSAPEVTDKLVAAIASDAYDFIVVNFANCDMVGHTGVLEAAIRAVEAVDVAIGRVWDAAREHGYALLLTSDHGNSEEMWDPTTNGPHTAHTTNPVPLVLLTPDNTARLRDGGRLADLAPTVLELMQLPQPPEMTGQSLLVQSR